MSITNLLKRFFMSFMFMVDDGDGGGPSGTSMEDLAAQFSDSGEEPEAQEGEHEPPEAESSDDQNDPVFTVQVDGQERQIKQSELLGNAGKYLAADKRAEEVDALRKQVEPEQDALKTDRARLQQALGHYTQQLTAMMQQSQPDWEQLLNSDPTKYLQARHLWEEQQAQLLQAQQAHAELMKQEREEQGKAAQARSLEEQNHLLTALPEWKDAVKAKAEAQEINGFLKAAGFSDEERDGLADHRVVLVARKAMLYDKLVAQREQLNGRLAKVPPRVESPGASSQGQLSEAKLVQAHKRFKAAPSIDTLADMFK